MTQEQFIREIAKHVQKYAPKYNIKVCSPIIAQAILESASGTSELAVNACNYFGLKYRKNRCPSACGIYYKVGSEQNVDGSYISSAMQWMKFSNMENGVIGYFDFINISNYKNLKGVTNPKTYLENIKKDGYATSLKYVDNLLAVINKYNLTQYDNNSSVINSEKYKVAIDAGHGSNTAGKRTPDGYREHWINVKCANYFDIAMKRCGIETVKIAWNDINSKDDVDVPLKTRQTQVKNTNCDISVSWHANAHGNGNEYTTGQGIETLIHNNPSKVGDSRNLANKVQSQLIKGTIQKNRGVKTQELSMCNCTAMGTKASILIEIGFMTNEYESGLLKTDAFCLECAEEVAKGVCEYLGIIYKPNVSIIINNNDLTSTSSSSTLIMKPTVKVNTTLNVRNAPNGTKVGSLTNGTVVDILDYQNGWLQIGTNRWISADYINNSRGRVNASILNIRLGAGTNFADIGNLKNNEIINIFEEQNGWYKILSSNHKFGWVFSKYINII